MKVLGWVEENIAALVLAAIAAVFAALGAWVSTIFVGAKFFRDEWSYGIPMAFGLPAAMVAAVAVFLVVFKKLSKQ
jgi:hypothetical protein